MGRVVIIEGVRITIPKEYRESLNLKKGDLLEYEIEDNKLILKYYISGNPTKDLFGLAADVTGDKEGNELFLEEVESKNRHKESKRWIENNL